jgi:two-component system CheB/CheR fusion protein
MGIINEELESSNEELQSTAELQTTNDERRVRTAEADKANNFLESILNGLDKGVVVIDSDFKILMWNRATEELWGLRADEVRGQSLLDLDIGLPVEALKRPVHSLLKNDASIKNLPEPIALDAVNRRGKAIRVRVAMALQAAANGNMQRVVLLMEKETE